MVQVYISGTGWTETTCPAVLQLDNIGLIWSQLFSITVTVSLFWWSITLASVPTPPPRVQTKMVTLQKAWHIFNQPVHFTVKMVTSRRLFFYVSYTYCHLALRISLFVGLRCLIYVMMVLLMFASVKKVQVCALVVARVGNWSTAHTESQWMLLKYYVCVY